MELFQEMTDLPMEDVAPGVRRFVFTLERVMLVYFELSPGARISEHAHPHEQMGMLMRGKIKWRMQGQERILEAPALYRIPSQEPHEVEVLGSEGARVLDVFSPIREDFLTKETPAYMKRS